MTPNLSALSVSMMKNRKKVTLLLGKQFHCEQDARLFRSTSLPHQKTWSPPSNLVPVLFVSISGFTLDNINSGDGGTASLLMSARKIGTVRPDLSTIA